MKKGFTLIELLVVVLIIGILAAIALPQYEKTVEKSRAAELAILLKNWTDAAQVYWMEQGAAVVSVDDLSIQFPHSYSNMFWSDNFVCYIEFQYQSQGRVSCSRADVTTTEVMDHEMANATNYKYSIRYVIGSTGEMEKTCTNSGTKDYCSSVKSVFGIE